MIGVPQTSVNLVTVLEPSPGSSPILLDPYPLLRSSAAEHNDGFVPIRRSFVDAQLPGTSSSKADSGPWFDLNMGTAILFGDLVVIEKGVEVVHEVGVASCYHRHSTSSLFTAYLVDVLTLKTPPTIPNEPYNQAGKLLRFRRQFKVHLGLFFV